MRWTLLTLSLLTIAGCGKDSADPTDDPFTPPVETGLSDSGGPVGPSYLNPVAVGFELDATLYDDGGLWDVRYTDGSTSPPFVRVIFADEEFFSLGAEQQAGHFCEVGGTITGIVPRDSSDPAFGTLTGSPLNWSYDHTLVLDLEFTGTRCGDMVDPDVWGVDAANLIGPFQGAHIGFGFGPMTDYMWDQWGGADDPANAEWLDKFFTTYIAINDRDGHWGGCDWTSALLFETDVDDIAVEDPDAPGSLVPLAVDAVGTGPMPKGYLRTFAYWYQDFPLMDFSNLTNAPVPGTSWLCE